MGYNPDQPRDEGGKWTSGGSMSDKQKAEADAAVKEGYNKDRVYKPHELAAIMEHDPSIARAQRAVLARGDARNDPGVLDAQGNYTPEALAHHEKIISSFLSDAALPGPNEQPVATLLLGKPGAGKSTALDQPDVQAGLPKHSVLLNSDEIQPKIDAKYHPDLAPSYHGRAGDVLEHLMETTIAGGYHLTYDGTGKNPDKMVALAKQLTGAGYQVRLLHVRNEDSHNRAFARFKNGGRHVPAHVSMADYSGIDRSYDALKNSGHVHSWRMYDNTERGKGKLKLLDKGGGGS